MKVCGIPVRFDATSPRIADARGIWPFKSIVVGRGWYHLPPEQRVAVLYHEARHCLGLHMELRILMLPLLVVARAWTSRVCQAQELECDRFAADAGFGPDFIAFLEEIHAEENLFYPSHAARARSIRAYLEGEQPC